MAWPPRSLGYPGALTLGLAEGIPAGIQGFVAAQQLAEQRRARQAWEALQMRQVALQEQAAQQAQQQFEMRQRALGALTAGTDAPPAAAVGASGAGAPPPGITPEMMAVPGLMGPGAGAGGPLAQGIARGRPGLGREGGLLIAAGASPTDVLRYESQQRVDEERRAGAQMVREALQESDPGKKFTGIFYGAMQMGAIDRMSVGDLQQLAGLDRAAQARDQARLTPFVDALGASLTGGPALDASHWTQAVLGLTQAESPWGRSLADKFLPVLFEQGMKFGQINQAMQKYAQALGSRSRAASVAAEGTAPAAASDTQMRLEAYKDLERTDPQAAALLKTQLPDVERALEREETRATAEAKKAGEVAGEAGDPLRAAHQALAEAQKKHAEASTSLAAAREAGMPLGERLTALQRFNQEMQNAQLDLSQLAAATGIKAEEKATRARAIEFRMQRLQTQIDALNVTVGQSLGTLPKPPAPAPPGGTPTPAPVAPASTPAPSPAVPAVTPRLGAAGPVRVPTAPSPVPTPAPAPAAPPVGAAAPAPAPAAQPEAERRQKFLANKEQIERQIGQIMARERWRFPPGTKWAGLPRSIKEELLQRAQGDLGLQ